MAHPFDDLVAKLARAGEHLESLKAQVNHFLGDDEANRIVNDSETEPDYLIIRAMPLRPTPVEFYILTGEILYHCRAALDYLACQLTEANKQTVDDYVEWPIFTDPDKFGAVGALTPGLERKIGKIDARHQQMIRDEQPFARWHGQPDQDPLAILYELARLDRHRFLHMSRVVATVARVAFEPAEAAARYLRVSTTYGPLDEDTEILRYAKLRGPELQAQVTCDVRLNVAFSERVPYANRYIVSTLAAICVRVGEVAQKFRPEFT
jgi:hypothetical protein